MKRLKKIKPSFWNKPGNGESHPHQPMNFQRKWKLIVGFTSLMALIPLLAVTIVDYRLTRRVMEEEMKNTMTGILETSALSMSYALDRQTAVVDHLITAGTMGLINSQEGIEALQNELTGLGTRIIGISLVEAGNAEKASPGMKKGAKQHYLTYEAAVENRPGELLVYLHCLAPDKACLKLSLDVEFMEQFLVSFRPDILGDIFVANQDGTLVTPSRFFGDAGWKTPFSLKHRDKKAGVFETAGSNEEGLLTGYAHIPSSSLSLVMVKSKHRIKELWFGPRLKLLGYLIFSIALILLLIMGMATYLVGRIHAADQKRIKALHHAGYSNKLASIGRLATSVAHEINNPLAIINEKTGLILDLMELEKERSPNERLSTLAKDVIKAVKRCGTVTRQLLEFARNMDPCKEPVDVEQTMQWVLTFFRREAKEHNIAVSLKTKGEPFLFHCDRGGLQQIFVNLLNNAFAAMDNDDSLDILIRYERSETVEITVSDTGCGIPKEEIHNIFEPFFTIKDKPSGTGLGLYVTFGIIKEMGGNIFVDSTLGKGTRFKVLLPATHECLPEDDLALSGEDSENTA